MFTFIRSRQISPKAEARKSQLSPSIVLAQAVQKVSANRADTGRLLCFYPDVTSNPFQRLLYKSSKDFGYLPIATQSIDGLVVTLDKEQGAAAQVDLHLHWVHTLFSGAKDEAEASDHAQDFCEKIQQLKSLGCRIIWTVHNSVSHQKRFLEAEITLRKRLGEIVDIIHIMNPGTVQLCVEYYPLNPDKCRVIPHPNYASIYPNTVNRSTSRAALDLSNADQVLLFFGSIAPYKGVKSLVRAHQDLLNTHPNLKLVIAGRTRDLAYLDEIRRATARVNILFHDQRIPDDRVQHYFNSADLVVCPYDHALNSGVAMTAVTFGKPLIVPESLYPTFAENPAVTPFAPDDDASLKNVIADVLHSSGDIAPATNWLQKRNAEVISSQFFEMLCDAPLLKGSF